MLNSFQKYAIRLLPEAQPEGSWVAMPDGESIMTYDEVDRMARYLDKIAPDQSESAAWGFCGRNP